MTQSNQNLTTQPQYHPKQPSKRIFKSRHSKKLQKIKRKKNEFLTKKCAIFCILSQDKKKILTPEYKNQKFKPLATKQNKPELKKPTRSIFNNFSKKMYIIFPKYAENGGTWDRNYGPFQKCLIDQACHPPKKLCAKFQPPK